jgi:hypothetical protein
MIVGLIAIALVGVEVGLETLRPPDATVRVINMGDTSITELKLSYGNSSALVPVILPQDSVVVRLSGRGKKPLIVDFRQLENAMTGFQIKDFDPAELRQAGSMLVLEIRPNEFGRQLEADTTPTPLGRLRKNIESWLGEEPDPDAK